MYESCIAKQKEVIREFSECQSFEDKYRKIIELGRKLPSIAKELKTPENKIHGCQSNAYLQSYLRDGVVIFEGEADAMISAGIIHLLISVYSGETPEVILKCEPGYIEELGIQASLTPSRANGMASMHLRMKQDALKLLMQKQKSISPPSH